MHPREHARTSPDKPACIMAKSGELLTYRQLDEASNRTAHLLRRAGLRAGDMVGVMMHNCLTFLEVTWAAQRSGLYYVSIPSSVSERELHYILSDSGARALLYSSDLDAVARAATESLPHVKRYPAGDAARPDSLERATETLPSDPIADEEPGQDMVYSSGTTGNPKGIKHPRPTGGISELTGVSKLAHGLYGMGPRSVYLCPAPLYHAAPLRFSMAAVQLGGTVVIMEKFDPEEALAAIERYRVTHAQWVPTHFVRMLKLPPSVRERYDMSSLVSTFHAAAPCPSEIKQQMIDWWGPIVHEYYGSSELNGLTAATAQEWLSRKGTVGRAVMGTIHICDEAGEPVPPRTEGAIYFSDATPIEYHNDPEKTRQAANQYGWTTVGDVGWVDEEGYLYLTDRRSFMIISGGVNIYPQEIENLLIEHPAVADAAVIGAPDADFGERVVAVVQPMDWSAAGDALARELDSYLRANLSPVKIPKQIDFLRELPRQPTGKLFKRLLRDSYRNAESGETAAAAR